MIMAYECWYKSLVPLMKSIREQMSDKPIYLTFDIDSIDPAYCPGTGLWLTLHLCMYPSNTNTLYRNTRDRWFDLNSSIGSYTRFERNKYYCS